MRAKRKASRETSKHMPAKATPVTTVAKVVAEKANKEDLSRYENEGGAEGAFSEVAGEVEKPQQA
jgi:hypothetical protein